MPTRISGACNGCRSKKQKCSGDKSGCVQCEAAGIPCTWPEQRKRGPAKGYIEGLEHRLHEAESVLLQLLPYVSTEQLQAATSILTGNDDDDNGVDTPDQIRSPPLLNKKTGMDYWENFPLTSVSDIRRWQQDCATNSASNQSSNVPQSIKSDGRTFSPSHASRTKRQKVTTVRKESRSATNFNEEVQLRDLYGMQHDQRASTQVIEAQSNHIHMGRERRRNEWQAPIIGLDSSRNGQSQQQIFQGIGSLNSHNPWQAMSSMHVNHGTDINQDVIEPLDTAQTQSHLFW